MQESPNTMEIALQNWQQREERYHSQIRPWMDAFRHRRERRQTHPIHDFLFEYYQFNRKLVSNWHPAIGDKLPVPEARRFLEYSQYSESNSTVFLDPLKLTETDTHRMEWICSLITAAMKNPERINCYGLHEWAMVYKSDCIRHESTPLRLEPEQIEATIESANICCTHYDAFRFFTQKAKPLNSRQPTADERRTNDQFGCVHFNMDLFKWCYKLHPWISSELTLDCFLLAVEARELDMRASPYDLQAIGYAPILIETTEGKQQYQSQQKAIAVKGRKLATRFLTECSELAG
jgi:hypothetical protein